VKRLRDPELDAWLVRLVLLGLFGLAAAYFVDQLAPAVRVGPMGAGQGIDFSINWTAARAAVNGTSLYSYDALRILSVQHVGAWSAGLYQSTFTDYLGPPSTAVLHIPYLWFPFGVAVVVHRVVSGLAFAAAVLIAGFALPKESRAFGWILGFLGLLTFQAVVISLSLGQLDAWVMLGLAVAFYGVRTRRWVLVGVGVGFAATLKLTPFLLLAYLLLRGRRRAVLAGAATCFALVGVASLVTGFSDLRTFVTDVEPKLAEGSILADNQSFSGYAAHALSGNTNYSDPVGGIGVYRYLGLAVAVALVLAIAWRRRHAPMVPLELGVVMLVALAFAPITWQHAASWAIVVLVLFADRRAWRPLRPWVAVAIVAGWVLMIRGVPYYSELEIQKNWWLRFDTGPVAVGLVLWLVAALALLSTRQVGAAHVYRGAAGDQLVGTTPRPR
jgi:Glycosyltransferase family 87